MGVRARVWVGLDASRLEVSIAEGARDCQVALHPPASGVDDLAAGRLHPRSLVGPVGLVVRRERERAAVMAHLASVGVKAG